MTALTTRRYVYQVPGDPADGAAATQALAASVDSDVGACLPGLTWNSLGYIGSGVMGSYGTMTPTGANYAHGLAFVPRKDMTPTSIHFTVSVQSGNYDLAILNSARTRLWSLGSTACPAAGDVTAAIAGGPTLTAGSKYYLVIAMSSATMAITAMTIPGFAAIGYDATVVVGEVSASFPIPASVGAFSGSTKLPYLAMRGV